MLRAITIEKFRAFERFSMEGLGRINLLVGTNNCGKTSVLEAVSILAAAGRPDTLWRVLARRGEHVQTAVAGETEVDVGHLFHGHEADLGASFDVRATNDGRSLSLHASVVARDAEAVTPDQLPRFPRLPLPRELDFALAGSLALSLHWAGAVSAKQVLAINRRGGIGIELIEHSRQPAEGASIVQFITTEALSRGQVVALFEEVVLTPEENTIIDALRTIEPAIERLASSGSNTYSPIFFPGRDLDRGGLFAKLSTSKQRIPIGSLGDGIWRLLGISLSLAKARGGILLIDEIDTGLHYSVMADMWRLVRDTAARLDVQVFATTHSRDCYESLAAISRADADTNSEVSIQRIEKGNPKAVAFSERDIVIAAQRSIEVR